MKIKKDKFESLIQQLEQQGKITLEQMLKTANLENDKTQLQTQIAELTKTRDELFQKVQEYDAQLIAERKRQNQIHQELQSQITEVSKKRDDFAHQVQERDTRVAQLTHDLADSERKLDAQRQEIDTLQNKVRTVADTQQENELLLLQLHQVQEELEHYFLQYQELQNKTQEAEARWNKFLARNPDYCEWDEINPIQIDHDDLSVRWKISGLMHAQRILPELEVTTSILQDCPTLILHRRVGEDAPLLINWPADNPDSVLLRVTDTEDQNEQLPYLLLNSLRITDWQLIKNIVAALINYLQVQSLQLAKNIDVAYWQEQLTILYQQIKENANAWRYDHCEIKREYVVPGYEHLWFKLENVTYGTRSWPSLEFRVGAALVKTKNFSQHPRFEFPLPHEGAKQFENWFEESNDGFGPKYELRFELTNMGMDLGAWHTLSLTDQKQMWAIAKDLPNLLTRLEKSGAHISRSWDDWQNIAKGMLKAMTLRAKLKTEEEESITFPC